VGGNAQAGIKHVSRPWWSTQYRIPRTPHGDEYRPRDRVSAVGHNPRHRHHRCRLQPWTLTQTVTATPDSTRPYFVKRIDSGRW